jgi:hypothetical protein
MIIHVVFKDTLRNESVVFPNIVAQMNTFVAGPVSSATEGDESERGAEMQIFESST